MSRIQRYPKNDVSRATLSDEQVRNLDWSKPVDQPPPQTRGGKRKTDYVPTPPPKQKYKRAPKRWLSNVQRAMAAKTGELPHQFMLRVMRLGVGAKIGNPDIDEKFHHVLDWEDIKWAAQNAGPYYAPRMAALHVKPDERAPINVQLDPDKIKKMTPEELNQMLQTIAAAMQMQQQLALPPPQQGEPPIVNGMGEIIDVDAEEYERTLQ